MPRLLFAPDFLGSLDKSAAELCDLFLLGNESEVPVERFSISSMGRHAWFPVGPGKYQTALFLLYCATRSSGTSYRFLPEFRPFLAGYYGKEIVEVARRADTAAEHVPLHLLLGDHVHVDLTLKPGYILPETSGRTMQELIAFAWERQAELGPTTPVPLIRDALHHFLKGVAEQTIPLTQTQDDQYWPSTIWLKRAHDLRVRLDSPLPVSA